MSRERKGLAIDRQSFVSIIFLYLTSYVFQGLISLLDIELSDAIVIAMCYVLGFYLMMFYISKRQVQRVSFFRILLLLSFFFYFGQHLLVCIDQGFLRSTKNYTVLSCNVSDESIIKAIFFIVRMLLVLYFGYSIGCSNTNRYYTADNNQEENDSFEKYLHIVFKLFFLISIIPAFAIAIYRMGLASSIGYSELREIDDTVYTSGGPIILMSSYIMQWFLPSTYMLILLNTGKKRISRLLVCILLAYSVLYVMSGSRFTILKIGVILFLIIYVWKKEFDIKEVIKIGLLLFGVGVIFSAISSSRDSMSNFSLATITKGLLSENPISPILWETGITFHSVSNILEHCPRDVGFSNGASYIGSLLVCLPGLFRGAFFETHEMSVSAVFSPFFYGNTYVGYGSSFIAEAYYNLGYLAPLGICLLGYVLGKMEDVLHKSSATRNVTLFYIVACIFGELAYGIRTDLWSVPRTCIFYILLPVFIAKVLSKITRT